MQRQNKLTFISYQMSLSLDLQKSLPEKQSFHLEMHLNMKPHKNKDKYYQLAFRCFEVVHPTSVSVLGGQLIHYQGCQLDRKMASAPLHWPGWSSVHPCHRERKGGSRVFNCCCHSDSEGIIQPRVNTMICVHSKLHIRVMTKRTERKTLWGHLTHYWFIHAGRGMMPVHSAVFTPLSHLKMVLLIILSFMKQW